jgi:bacillithiol biosynthesis cysteine-adding enzyme BshC
VNHLRLEPERIASPPGLVAALLEGDLEATALFPSGVLASADLPVTVGGTFTSVLDSSAFHCPEPASRDKLDAVLAGGGLVVATGQQPQLFGGPLYVLYKALSAIRHAACLERRLGIPCLAVFWVAADDHDWREVASVHYLDAHEKLGQVSIAAPPGRTGLPVGPTELPSDIGVRVEEFLGALEAHEAGERWRGVLSDHYRAGRSFTDAFIGVAGAWTAGLPIAFLDSAHPDVRRASVQFIQGIIEKRDLVEEALRIGTDRVAELGYTPQLSQAQGAIPVFRDGVSGRYRLRETSSFIQVDADGASRTASELLEEVASHPERFSPSAALRPVLESWLLPVATSVLGPGEIAYWAQLGPLFRALDLTMPAVRARDSWRVVEPRVVRLLNRTGTDADDLRDGGAGAVADLVARSGPQGVESALARFEKQLDRGFGELDSVVEADFPGLRSAVGKSRSQCSSALAALRKTLSGMTRDRERIAISQLRRAAVNLYPDGKAQERALAAWVYLARHGDTFLEAVRAASVDTPSPDTAGPANGVAGASPAE